MCALLVVLVLTAASLTNADESMHVGGVRVFGRLHDVSIGDIRKAIAEIGAERKASEVEVISSSQMHVYLRPHDLGWIPVESGQVIEPGGRKRVQWFATVKGIDEPEVLGLIRTADEVYVFPVATPLKPHRDDKHLRLLGAEGRRKLVRLLGDQRSWWQGMYEIPVIDDGSRGVGLLFRHGKNELVLFSSRITDEEGTFNGRHVAGLLHDDLGRPQMEEWKRRYAQPELAAK